MTFIRHRDKVLNLAFDDLILAVSSGAAKLSEVRITDPFSAEDK